MGAAAGGLAGAASAATPWLSMGLGAVNIATDLVQAGKQKDVQKSAERAAETAAREQERLLSQDFFSGLQVPTEAYQRAARETTAQVGQAVGALQEGDSRQLAGGLGKVAAAGIAGEAETRDAMGQDLYKLGLAQAQSATNVNQKLADLQGDRLTGAQDTAAQARAAELGLQQGAAQAGAGILSAGLGMIPSFGSAKQAPQTPTQQAQSSNSFYRQPNPSPDWMSSLSFLNKVQ